ncbi:Hypothetical predicted protein, partial [Paramuricea clavata]
VDVGALGLDKWGNDLTNNVNGIEDKVEEHIRDHMIEKWRVVVADIRKNSTTATVGHNSEFVRKRVKAEFDQDFGVDLRDSRSPRNDLDPPRRDMYDVVIS